MWVNTNCAQCKKPFKNGENKVYLTRSNRQGEDTVHMECADNNMRMKAESRTEFHAWQIQKLRQEFDQEKASLGQRTTALLFALTTLMEKQGATQEEIQDLRYEFAFQDQPQGQPQGQPQTENS